MSKEGGKLALRDVNKGNPEARRRAKCELALNHIISQHDPFSLCLPLPVATPKELLDPRREDHELSTRFRPDRGS
jgi:hypothetical protein